MGVVFNQSAKNTITTYLGFAIGAINVLFLYTQFLSPEYFGLISYILSTANILMPLMAFGVHNTIIKFYSSFKSRQSQNSFLTLMLFLPLAIIIPFGFIGWVCFNEIANWMSADNIIVKDYVWLIYVAAVSFAYFEVFYAWSRVQFQSVFGNFMKEVFHRLGIMILLLLLHFELLATDALIYGIVGIYIVRMIIMKLYAYSLHFPRLQLSKLPNIPSILKYTSLIILAGSVANIILEIDKFMINRYVKLDDIAYYSVATFVAAVISVPARSMHQIVSPITAKLLNEKNKKELAFLYKKSSLNLFIICGYLFLLIVLNINELYKLIDERYANGIVVVFAIGIAKLMEGLLGNNNAILFNSDYYRKILLFGVVLVFVTIVLNLIFIPTFGINGAAFASLIAFVIYNVIKIWFVYSKFKIMPFTVNTGKVLVLILVSLGVFYYWDFAWHPAVSILIKSALISCFYGVVVYTLNLSDDITVLINRIIKR
ncbi:oligosaccharide flippase family protein [Mangrovimonas cancribranchiae]|uniref:Polysaccharide biosynthesis C-terminal domain-containing protein n=1 Tax=Mangrovimonas cancribranchiae TaxID=3080055 RepID=A0AAU6P068_9FLAO